MPPRVKMLGATLAVLLLVPLSSSSAGQAGRQAKSKPLQLSVLRRNNQPEARALTDAVIGKGFWTYNRNIVHPNRPGWYGKSNEDLQTILKFGFKIPAPSLPPSLARLADKIEIWQWKKGQPHVLDKELAGAIADRLHGQAEGLRAEAKTLHRAMRITNRDLERANDIADFWTEAAAHFAKAAQVLGNRRIALDE